MSTEDPDNITRLSHGYWKSLAELEGKAIYQTEDSEIEGDEFPPPAEEPADPLSRRSFFQLMGSSMALAGVAGAGCKRYQKEEIVPLARRPEDQVPGGTMQYATAYELAGAGHALLATSYEGRPIKLDGNPDHPFANGGVVPGTKRHCGTTAFAQASILSLYDPDRSQNALEKGKASTFEAFKTWLGNSRPQLAAGAARIRVLSEATSSPTIAALKKQLVSALPGASWYEWEPISWDNERQGIKLAFGKFYRSMAKLDKAQTIVALDCDLFVDHPAAVRYNRDFAKARRPSGGSLGEGQITRLWAVESIYSNTGACADHRLPLRSEHVLPFLMAIDARLSGAADPSAKFLSEGKVPAFLSALAEELRSVRSGAVLVAGRRQPPAVHALVAKINYQLGAIGQTIDYLDDPDPDRQLTHLEAITKLVGELDQNTVETLIILGGNPVYDAPADLKFGAALAKAATSIHLSEYANETSVLCSWHVPRAHYLESWGDARTWDGTVTVGQPLIVPMYGGISSAELLSLLVGQDLAGDRLIKKTYETSPWTYDRKAQHDGFIDGTQLAAVKMADLTLNNLPAVNLTPTQLGTLRAKNGEIEIAFAPSSHTFDGRFANNAWLQETPDFLTKVTWDNHALVSPATAKELGLDNDTLIKIKVNGVEMEVPCYTMPGQARFSIGVMLGGGRTRAGVVGGNGKKQVGFDTYKLRASGAMDIATGATVAATGKSYWLANVQEHWDIRKGLDKQIGQKGQDRRLPEIVRATEIGTFRDGKYEAREGVEFWPEPTRGRSLFRERSYPGEAQPPGEPVDHARHAWAMAIDLNSCTGCNACMVACQAENNVPVVGKNQVFKNREMHWIRIDRYFRGNIEDPEIAHQPLACQQCENAPCEQVCPVGATTHSNEGLNDMAYNRCIGTRYCLNNCPYRVRRFNFFDYHTEFNDARNKVRKLLFNPDVTVRARGVMEKCTFCVQRIQNGKIAAKAAGRPLVDGDIVTACQAACPAEAIVFGDLADKTSRVSQLHGERRAYGLLDEELYTKPRNQYLARVKNPNSDTQLAAFSGKAGPSTAAHGGAHE
jgi:MoCo/4Fe-4S cofactor protein with predicted Tat translocation signal